MKNSRTMSAEERSQFLKKAGDDAVDAFMKTNPPPLMGQPGALEYADKILVVEVTAALKAMKELEQMKQEGVLLNGEEEESK